ncbi:hypothetical protein D3C83_191160 [compost metagenome]
MRQGVHAVETIGYERIARIFAWQNHRQLQTIRQRNRNILHGVHGQVRITVQQLLLQLLDEQTLPAQG